MSIFVENMSSAAAGRIAHSPAYDRARRMAQDDASKFFLSLGEDIERKHGKLNVEHAMYVLGDIMALVEMAAPLHSLSDDKADDLVSFFVQRIRHNADRLFPSAARQEAA